MLGSRRMVIEVHVNVEFLPIQILVGPAAGIVLIVEEICDACNLARLFQKRGIAHQRVEPPVRRPERAQIGMKCLAPDAAGFVDGMMRIEWGEFVNQAPAESGVEKIVDDNVPKWPSLGKVSLELFESRPQLRMRHPVAILR
jgi:hypothetical protein